MIYRLSMHIHRDMMPVKLVETSPFAGIRGLYLREGGDSILSAREDLGVSFLEQEGSS